VWGPSRQCKWWVAEAFDEFLENDLECKELRREVDARPVGVFAGDLKRKNFECPNNVISKKMKNRAQGRRGNPQTTSGAEAKTTLKGNHGKRPAEPQRRARPGGEDKKEKEEFKEKGTWGMREKRLQRGTLSCKGNNYVVGKKGMQERPPKKRVLGFLIKTSVKKGKRRSNRTAAQERKRRGGRYAWGGGGYRHGSEKKIEQ